MAVGSMSSSSSSWMEELIPFVGMVGLESFMVGLTMLNKAALMKGMSPFIFVFYSNALAALLISPFAYFFDRNKRPALTMSLLCKFFFMSLIGITLTQNLIAVAIDYSSPTLSSAMMNLIPAFTFILAVILRMENLNWRRSTAQIKIIGTVLSILGALIVVFYNGHKSMNGEDQLTMRKESNWIFAGLLFAFAWLLMALWIVLQKPFTRGFPARLTLAAFYLLFASIQCGVVCFVVEGYNPSAWTLMPHRKIKLIATIYAAVFGRVGVCYAEVWCISKKGPVFVSMFKPLNVAIAAFMSFILFRERLHFGIIAGTAIIVTGFYGVLWAKSKENREIKDSNNLPLLQNEE